MSTIFSPDIILLNIAKKCRSKLFEDIFAENSDLYAVLYSDNHSEIYRVYQERYDLIWLKSHWDLISEYISTHKLNATQKGQLLSRFAKWYCDFLNENNSECSIKYVDTRLMREIIDLKIENLESIIEFDKRCNENMQRINTSFMKSIKLMNDEVNKMNAERKR